MAIDFSPSGLAEASKCYCYPKELAQRVKTYLWAVITDHDDLSPSELASAAACYCYDAKHAALQASINAKIAALVAAYSNLQWCADNWASVTNLATLRIAVKAEGDLLLKLGPVLREIYKPENDTTP